MFIKRQEMKTNFFCMSYVLPCLMLMLKKNLLDTIMSSCIQEISTNHR